MRFRGPVRCTVRLLRLAIPMLLVGVIVGCNSDGKNGANDRTREIPPETKTEELRDSTRLDPAPETAGDSDRSDNTDGDAG